MKLKVISVRMLLLVVCLLAGFTAGAQQTLIDVKVDTADILVGEQTTLHVTVTTDPNRRIIIPAGTEFGAKGATIVGGVGLGIYDSYEAGADATVTITREYEPNPQRAALYSEFFEVYRSLRASTVDVWDQLQSATRKASVFVA